MLVERVADIRKRPLEVRRRFALVFSITVTAVVIGIWIAFSLAMSWAEPDLPVVEENVEEQPSISDMFRGANTFISEQLDTMPSAAPSISTSTDDEAQSVTFDPSSFDPSAFDPYADPMHEGGPDDSVQETESDATTTAETGADPTSIVPNSPNAPSTF